MSLKQEIMELSRTFPSAFEEDKDGALKLEIVLAEWKKLFFKRKVTYRCRLRVDDVERAVRFFEILKETGPSFMSGGDDGPSFGFKKEVYRVSGKEREGSVTETNLFFGKDAKYSFDYGAVRTAVRAKAENAGYSFTTCLREKSC